MAAGAEYRKYRNLISRHVSKKTLCSACESVVSVTDFEQHFKYRHKINPLQRCVWCRNYFWRIGTKMIHGTHLYQCCLNYLESYKDHPKIRSYIIAIDYASCKVLRPSCENHRPPAAATTGGDVSSSPMSPPQPAAGQYTVEFPPTPVMLTSEHPTPIRMDNNNNSCDDPDPNRLIIDMDFHTDDQERLNTESMPTLADLLKPSSDIVCEPPNLRVANICAAPHQQDIDTDIQQVEIKLENNDDEEEEEELPETREGTPIPATNVRVQEHACKIKSVGNVIPTYFEQSNGHAMRGLKLKLSSNKNYHFSVMGEYLYVFF